MIRIANRVLWAIVLLRVAFKHPPTTAFCLYNVK